MSNGEYCGGDEDVDEDVLVQRKVATRMKTEMDDGIYAKQYIPRGLLPVGRALNTSPGRRPGGILTRYPSHLIWLLSTRRSSGSTLSSSRMTELLTLSLRESPATLRRKLISAACTRDLVLSFDGIPHRRCPPAGSGIATTAGTDHLAATAPVGRLNNGGAEHGPLKIKVPRLPRYMVKALPEVGVEALSDRRLCKTFPADPHNTFGSARSDQHPPPPS
ncbi:hypothetical protein N1851_027129 [Merluccius polli]|uniref:Uncharacterized protein n=1 Tax=Merluccius polli TaxID=89951 RepID=A0AA47MAV1_MERPO|nr:hypothetical protein N1851_027129 [Merluccius polli]